MQMKMGIKGTEGLTVRTRESEEELPNSSWRYAWWPD